MMYLAVAYSANIGGTGTIIGVIYNFAHFNNQNLSFLAYVSVTQSCSSLSLANKN